LQKSKKRQVTGTANECTTGMNYKTISGHLSIAS